MYELFTNEFSEERDEEGGGTTSKVATTFSNQKYSSQVTIPSSFEFSDSTEIFSMRNLANKRIAYQSQENPFNT